VTGSNQSEADLQLLIASALGPWAHINALINSAGHGPRGPILDISDAQWHAAMEVYFLNVARAVRQVAPHLRARGCGAIVNISTAWAFEPSPLFPTSAVFRAGLAAHTKLAAESLAPDNIRINNLLLGWIDSLPQTEERRVSVPLRCYGKAEEIAATFAFLVSEGAAHITGQNLRVDGGLMRSL
jgi:NAD(P)-dependent dehydrogenase (short-subunit alcohol dehydrogenase family)